jgi:hypothetical protein
MLSVTEKPFMLNVIMMNVIMLNVIMMNVVMLSVGALIYWTRSQNCWLETKPS